MKQHFTVVAAFVIAALALTSCHKTDIPGFKKTSTGLHYKFETQNPDGQKVQDGDILYGEMVVRFDSITFGSNAGQPMPIMQANPGRFDGDIAEGLLMMHVGDKATFAIDADAWATVVQPNQMPPQYQKGAGQHFYYEIRLDSIITKEQADAEQKRFMEEMEQRKQNEPTLIDQYVRDNNIKVQPDEDGLYVIVTKRGNGPVVATGKTVEVNYTGRLLDGKLFDTSVESVAEAEGKHIDGREYKPFTYVAGKTGLIKGWDKGVSGLPAGSQVKLVIPSAMGYGERGAGADIPPYSPLVFTIDILSVK
ncbi:MAG: FKBP-type peptidyl-prolyl cis-trans isomerase [Bacteroidales bacterium]|nr:FKBP-type peptidyl-prolyl cis-trans isomerase [Bacteroidales bacterium]